jgi:hypothetical protein
LRGNIDPRRGLDHETDLEHIDDAYAAMDETAPRFLAGSE